MAFIKNDDAVSPVIGVILMVAITVILAAVIAAFVFGMAGNIQKSKVVAATVAQQGSDIAVTYQGGQDDASVGYLKIAVPNNQTATVGPWYTGAANGGATGASGASDGGSSPANSILSASTSAVKPATGSVYILKDKGTSARDSVTVTCHFADGSEQVIMDTTV
jgi:flagellin-like protein